MQPVMQKPATHISSFSYKLLASVYDRRRLFVSLLDKMHLNRIQELRWRKVAVADSATVSSVVAAVYGRR